MSPLATVETDLSVEAMLEAVEHPGKREDSQILLNLMREVTGEEPKVWGDNFIIGFGKYSYTRKGSKEELEWFNVGFAPRKSTLTVYLTFDIREKQDLLDKLGKHKVGKGCLYINKLADVDLDVLKELIVAAKDSRWH